jgi:hypothetical protein
LSQQGKLVRCHPVESVSGEPRHYSKCRGVH